MQVDGKPLLKGLFGVCKEEWSKGHEVFRLMNLVPYNGSLMKGDMETLPMWSFMSPFYLKPGETLIITSSPSFGHQPPNCHDDF